LLLTPYFKQLLSHLLLQRIWLLRAVAVEEIMAAVVVVRVVC
jgi:hypothetical protein